jgi:hypothetical protein
VSEQLDAVGSVLASVPVPTLPDAFESRITAALAAEAATRATQQSAASPAGAGAAGRAAQAGGADRIPSHRRPRQARPRRQLSLRFHPAMAAVPVVILLIVGFGFLVSRSNPSSSSSSALSESAPASAASAASSASAGAAAAEPAAGSAPASRAAKASMAPFLVVASGRNYTAVALATQVRSELDKLKTNIIVNGAASNALPSPAPSTRLTPSDYRAYDLGGTTPSTSLIGCVQHLTGKAQLDLVERARYQGRQVYLIVAASKAWVVGLGCTADNSELLATATLSPAH